MPKRKKALSDSIGWHNKQYIANPVKVVSGNSYRDRSTICFIPTLGSVSVRWVQAYISTMKAMNQKFSQIFLDGHEVGKAYEQMIDIVKNHPELRTWKYILTIEHDNLIPPDGLLKLYEDIESGPWDAVGGLYWLKGEGGKPMSYGRPRDDNGAAIVPFNFAPWLPPPGTVSEVNGLGMGATLFKTKMLLDPNLPRPLFLTEQSYVPGEGIRCYTQDLRAFQILGQHGYRFAVSTRCLVGHYDSATDTVW
jgi:hypothetical protein